MGIESGGVSWTFEFFNKSLSWSNSQSNEWYYGTYTINITQNPKQIDIMIRQSSVSQNDGKVLYGIFKMESGVLTIILNEPGDVARPSGFSGTAGRMFIFNRAAPIVRSPSNKAISQSTSASMLWWPSSGAVTYRLQVATDSLFHQVIYDDSTITGSSKQVNGLANATVYYWRVKSKNSLCTSLFSPVQSFTTIKMISVTGGTFQMGDNFNEGYSETPLHSVTVNSYYVSEMLVTQGQWTAIMDTNPSHFTNLGDNAPVDCVNWFDCIKFCNKLSIKEGKLPCYNLNGNTSPSDWTSGIVSCNFTANGYRLPTEAEWEYAARGRGNVIRYAGTSKLDSLCYFAWYADNSSQSLHLVGTKLPNSLGLYDMNGNVWEWCWDWYGLYKTDSLINPTGPGTGWNRVLRGGSWNDFDGSCRNSCRKQFEPSYGYRFGLRIVTHG